MQYGSDRVLNIIDGCIVYLCGCVLSIRIDMVRFILQKLLGNLLGNIKNIKDNGFMGVTSKIIAKWLSDSIKAYQKYYVEEKIGFANELNVIWQLVVAETCGVGGRWLCQLGSNLNVKHTRYKMARQMVKHFHQ